MLKSNCTKTASGTATDSLENLLLEAREILQGSGRVYSYGGGIFIEVNASTGAID